MEYIKVWCEWDFNGNFGSRDILSIRPNTNTNEIDALVIQYLKDNTGVSRELEIDCNCGWDFTGIDNLN